MKGNMERYQVVYSVLKTHIQFGIYGFGDVLPSIENAAADFFVSVDTMRAAYQQLQRDGLVTISTNIGTTVVRNYGKEEIEQNIQMFYAQRKNILIDLSKSLRPLLGHAQWIGFKNIPAEIYGNLRQLEDSHSLPQTTTFEHVVRAYTALGNNLLFRLVWQIFMFCENPFFNMRDNPWRTFIIKDFLPRSWDCCIKQDWVCLRELVYASQDSLSLALMKKSRCLRRNRKSHFSGILIIRHPRSAIRWLWICLFQSTMACTLLIPFFLLSTNCPKRNRSQ